MTTDSDLRNHNEKTACDILALALETVGKVERGEKSTTLLSTAIAQIHDAMKVIRNHD